MEQINSYCLGKYIYLGPILEKHLFCITKWLNDPEVIKFLDLNKPVIFEDVKKSWETLDSRKQSDIVFSICLKEGMSIIGEIGIHCINTVKKTAMVGLFIGKKDLWNRGYGTEAQILLLEYVFTNLDINKIFADVYSSNIQSQRSFEKCGYLREEEDGDGSKIRLSILKKDFLLVLDRYKRSHLKDR